MLVSCLKICYHLKEYLNYWRNDNAQTNISTKKIKKSQGSWISSKDENT